MSAVSSAVSFIRSAAPAGAARRSRRPSEAAGAVDADALRDVLLKAGVRATEPRLRVLRLFVGGASGALSASQVMRTLYDRGEDASLSSVYAVLRLLEKCGLVVSRFEDGRRVFEEAGRLPQARVLCGHCGAEQAIRDARLDDLLRELAGKLGCSLSDYKVLISGAGEAGCPACREHCATG